MSDEIIDDNNDSDSSEIVNLISKKNDNISINANDKKWNDNWNEYAFYTRNLLIANKNKLNKSDFVSLFKRFLYFNYLSMDLVCNLLFFIGIASSLN